MKPVNGLILLFPLVISASPICDIFLLDEACQVSLDNLVSLVSGIAAPELCQEECLNDLKCSNFTWIQPSGAEETKCYLLSDCSALETCPSDASQCLSGPRTPGLVETCCQDFQTDNACDDQENLISFSPETEPELCQKKCQNESGCKVFSLWNDFCFLYTQCNHYVPCTDCVTGGNFPEINRCLASPGQSFKVLMLAGSNGPNDFLGTTELVTYSIVCLAIDIPEIPEQYRRFGAFAELIDESNIILCGGTYYNSRDDCIYIDMADEFPAWTPLNQMTSTRHFAASVNINGDILAIAGYSGQTGTVLPTVERLTSLNGQWSVVPELELPDPRESHCAVTISGNIVVIGGVGFSSVISLNYDHFQRDGKASWNSLPSLPRERFDHRCDVIDNGKEKGIIVTGGYSYEENQFLPEALFFDWSKQIWIIQSVLYNPRYGHGFAVAQGVPTVFGGFDYISQDDKSNETRALTDIVEIYDNGVWVDSRLRLLQTRDYFSIVKIPEELMTC